MNRAQLESRVHRIIDDVLAGRPVEDDMVELKSDWPDDSRRAARRIAGHANAARQQPVIWVLGVDETAHIVSGASAIEPATWYDQLKAQFADGWAPAVRVFNIPRDGRIVVALVFETEGAPFLVRTAYESLEIPWRSATMVRSAKRQELLAMFGDVTAHPDVDLLETTMTARENRVIPPDRILAHTFDVNMQVYLTPRLAQPLHIPLHRTNVSFYPEGAEEPLDFGPAQARDANRRDTQMDIRARQVAVTVPMFVIFSVSRQLPVVVCPDTAGTLRLRLGIAGSEKFVLVEVRVEPSADRSTADCHWWLPT